MNGAELLIVVVGGLAVTTIAHRTGRQAPLLVVAVGFVASFLPGLPRFEIDPGSILSIVVPPLLYSTALRFSVTSFRRMLRPILSLGVWLVLLLWGVMGAVSAALIPGLGVASALVLSAVIAPPDAVTAVSIGRSLGLPRRLMTVLTGESLINDAMALTLFTYSVVAITKESSISHNIAVLFVYGAAVGLAIGLAIGWIVRRLRGRINDPAIETVVGLLVPFGAYLVAESVHASGVVAVVAAGFYLGHFGAEAGYSTRLQERAVLETVDTLLEALVFAYMGLQLRFVIDDLKDAGLRVPGFLGASCLVLLIAMAVRVVFVFFTEIWRRLWAWRRLAWHRRHPDRPPAAVQLLGWKETTVASWTGMRGVVTVAAAAGIPDEVPGKVQIQAVAFVVAVGTLLVQGSTLPALIGWLKISDPGEAEQDEQERRRAAQVGRSASAKVLQDAARTNDVNAPPAVREFLSRMRLTMPEQDAPPDGIRSVEVHAPAQTPDEGAAPGADRPGADESARSLPPGRYPASMGTLLPPGQAGALNQLMGAWNNRTPSSPPGTEALVPAPAAARPVSARADHPPADASSAWARMAAALVRGGGPGGPGGGGRLGREAMEQVGRIRNEMLQAQREALIAERDAGRLDDEIMREVLEQLDLEQAAAAGRVI